MLTLTRRARQHSYGQILACLSIWRRVWTIDNDSDDQGQRTWIGPDNSRFSVRVAPYKPEYGNRSIEDETTTFYEDHKRHGGEEDLRYLEVDGVKGIHYLRDEKGWDRNYQPQDEKLINWNTQRMYRGARQSINVTLSTSSRKFIKSRGTLYGLLQSIKFTQNA